MRILLFLTLFVFQIFSVASAKIPTLYDFFPVTLQDHHHGSEPSDLHMSGEFPEDDGGDYEKSAQFHEHKHRHSPGEPEHSHSHSDLTGHMHTTCLFGGTVIQLNLYKADLAFPFFDDKAVQSPLLNSLFRPPII